MTDLLSRHTDGNNESVAGAEVGEARWSQGGCRQLAASWGKRGQFLLAEGRQRGMALLIQLGGRQN